MGIFLGSIAILVVTLILVGAMYLWVVKNYPPKSNQNDKHA